MTVNELRAELAYVPGDAIVRLWCDHGQMSMKASTVTRQHMNKKDRESWVVEDADSEVPEGSGCNVVEIGAP
jgi:hypothetical protein